MKEFEIKFSGREIGAIGAMFLYTATRTAENLKTARGMLYDKFQDVLIFEVKEDGRELSQMEIMDGILGL